MTEILLQPQIAKQLAGYFDEQEAASIARILSEFLTESGSTRTITSMEPFIERIKGGEPVQYIVGNAWFYNLRLRVDKHVLIPRPETEELVHWIISDSRAGLISQSSAVLDIGTGSGCIACALKRNIPQALVKAIDISKDALNVARDNAAIHHLAISFDILDILTKVPEEHYDIIVSNPPYITASEFQLLPTSVKNYEPEIALTAPSEDGLVFYRRLGEIGHRCLSPNGTCYLELNEFHAKEIEGIFINNGYRTELRQDMQGKWRMLKCDRVRESSPPEADTYDAVRR